MAASTIRKFFLPVRFTYSTRVTRMPALPEMNLPGSIRILRPSGLSNGNSRAAYFCGVSMRLPWADFHHAAEPLANAGS